MGESRNRFGEAYGLTVMHPILPGHDVELAALLDEIPGGDASPLARVPGTHSYCPGWHEIRDGRPELEPGVPERDGVIWQAHEHSA